MRTFVINRVGNVTETEALRELNTAWQELWDTQDVPGCLETVLVQPEDRTAQQLALPGFVGRIQGIRFATWGPTVRLNYPTAYFQGMGKWQSALEWAAVSEEPIKRQLTNVSPLTFTLPAPIADDVQITVVGNSTGADRARETVTIHAGDRAATSTLAFGPFISSITKTAHCAKDITITDKDAIEVAVLGASELQTRYIIVKLYEACFNYVDVSEQSFEILYKKRCPVLFFDEDTVPTPFHVAVQNQAVASLLGARSGDGDLTRASAFSARAARSVSAMAADRQRGTTVRLDTGKNSLYTRYRGRL
jgi:hypothetical protein